MDIPIFIDQTKPLKEGFCKSCKKSIYWGVTTQGKPHPLDPDGRTHFGTCPNTKYWSKKKSGEHL